MTRLGPWCPTCGSQPAIEDGPCHRCRLLSRVTGVLSDQSPGVSRFDAMVSMGAAYRSDSPEFEIELQWWLQ